MSNKPVSTFSLIPNDSLECKGYANITLFLSLSLLSLLPFILYLSPFPCPSITPPLLRCLPVCPSLSLTYPFSLFLSPPIFLALSSPPPPSLSPSLPPWLCCCSAGAGVCDVAEETG